MEFGELIAYRISSLDPRGEISVNRIAVLSELSQTAVEKIMNGKTKNPNFFTLASLAKGFNMTLSEFLDFPEMNELTFQDLRRFRKTQKEPLTKP